MSSRTVADRLRGLDPRAMEPRVFDGLLTVGLTLLCVGSQFFEVAGEVQEFRRTDAFGIALGLLVLAINIFGFALNQAFVWYLVKYLDGPTWWPTIPMVLFTPLLTFALHRRFVYS